MSNPPIDPTGPSILIAPKPELSQGDILSNAAFAVWKGGLEVELLRPRLALVLNHDCDIDKPDGRHVLLAQIHPLTVLGPERHEHVRASKVLNLYYLGDVKPGEESSERYADFRQTARADKTAALALPKVASLSEEGVAALQRRLAIWFGYGRGGLRPPPPAIALSTK